MKNETEEHMKFEQLIATYRQSGFDGIPGWGILSKSRGFSADEAKKYAQRAQKELNKNTPEYIKAGDIIKISG